MNKKNIMFEKDKLYILSSYYDYRVTSLSKRNLIAKINMDVVLLINRSARSVSARRWDDDGFDARPKYLHS